MRMYCRLMFRSMEFFIPSSSAINNHIRLCCCERQSLGTVNIGENFPVSIDDLSTKIKNTNETISQNKIIRSSSNSTNLSNVNKVYSQQIQRIANEISKLTLVEIMDLNELLKVNVFLLM